MLTPLASTIAWQLYLGGYEVKLRDQTKLCAEKMILRIGDGR